jgi:hypothetical protein
MDSLVPRLDSWHCSFGLAQYTSFKKAAYSRKKYPAVGASTRPTILKWYLLIVLMEVLAIVLVLILANRLRRAYLATDWCAMIVGLHFLPLAKIFRAPRLIVLGILMMLWCALSRALFRSNTIAISASLGTGILLWGTCAFALFRARRIAQSVEKHRRIMTVFDD